MQIGQLSGTAEALVLMWLKDWRQAPCPDDCGVSDGSFALLALMEPEDWRRHLVLDLFSWGPVYLISWDELLFSRPRKGRARRERPRNLNEDSNKSHKCIPTWQNSNISVLISHIRSKNTRDVLGMLTAFFFFSFCLSAPGKYIYLDKIFSRLSFFV